MNKYETNFTDFEILKKNTDYRINLKTGTIINKHNRILKTKMNGRIYHTVSIKGCNGYLSRVVYAQKHGPIPVGYDVDHIDDNPSNNCIDNLQVLTRRENIIKSIPNRDYSFTKNNVKNAQHVKAINIETKEVIIYKSIYACSKHLNINPGIIQMTCKGTNRCKTGFSKNNNKRYSFSYTTDDPTPSTLKPKIDFDEHFKCKCGGTYKRRFRHVHNKTKKHKSFDYILNWVPPVRCPLVYVQMVLEN